MSWEAAKALCSRVMGVECRQALPAKSMGSQWPKVQMSYCHRTKPKIQEASVAALYRVEGSSEYFAEGADTGNGFRVQGVEIERKKTRGRGAREVMQVSSVRQARRARIGGEGAIPDAVAPSGKQQSLRL